MTKPAIDNATRAQISAARPDRSTWLAANAGSGKTRVLTDRVARLLRQGVSPQNILCLTYTKAAATEMQNRLFSRLGEWAMKPDEDLQKDLSKLGETAQMGAEDLAHARTLFARALETPGGLRIQTIHSFCASILRRFPMEAGVSPQFVEIDDTDAAHLRSDVFEQMAADPQDAGLIDAAAVYLNEFALPEFLAEVAKTQASFQKKLSENDIMAAFGLTNPVEITDLWNTIFGLDHGFANEVARQLQATESPKYIKMAAKIASLNWAAPNWDGFALLCEIFLDGGKSKAGKIPQANFTKIRQSIADFLPELDAFMDRIAAAHALHLAQISANRTKALHDFAYVYLARYSAAKTAKGWLDFDDLIINTRDLLRDETLAQWVLFRLDGGIDHILVDEAQDTSPLQWEVIEMLAAEFTSGEGAQSDKARTIFVVGDKKQSIYSFQGADPREFDRMANRFSKKLADVDDRLTTAQLAYSFRSASAVLKTVDAVIPPQVETAAHKAFHQDLPGRVDLWPTVLGDKKAPDRHWTDPVDHVSGRHPKVELANKIAETIKAMLDNGQPIYDAKTGFRPVRAGDFLILVRGRKSGLFDQIIRACKAASLPLAGADRMALGAELAVRDLQALLKFLVTPEDDLSLAAALKSPLLGWDEAQLYDLAHGRGNKYLWAALRDNEAAHSETLAVLKDLRNCADYMRPYDLLERILIKHNGRKLLLGRLSVEAEDGINALLSKALHYEAGNIPSVTGFIDWLQSDAVEIKRQIDSAGDLIRVMTVHGAKGLESPIVILPDTISPKKSVTDEIIFDPSTGAPLWKTPASSGHAETMQRAIDEKQGAITDEIQRLLYVAMTRAEKWLIVCAAGDKPKDAQSWHDQIETALRAVGAAPFMQPTGEGLRLENGDWPEHAVAPADPSADQIHITLPDWATTAPAAPAPAARKCNPSDLGGAKALSSETGLDPETAMQYGTLVHLLLEHLPQMPPAERERSARAILAAQGGQFAPHLITQIIDEALNVLAAPDLHFLFDGPALCEVDITATLPLFDNARMNGTIDRLIVSQNTVIAADYKTNRAIPASAQECPLGVLRQQAAYHAALKQIYPDHEIIVGIIWTVQAKWMALPQPLLQKTFQALQAEIA